MQSTIVVVLIVAGIVIALLALSRASVHKRIRQSADGGADGGS